MKDETRLALAALREHCGQQVDACKTRIQALQANDATGSAVAGQQKIQTRWESWRGALDEVLATS